MSPLWKKSRWFPIREKRNKENFWDNSPRDAKISLEVLDPWPIYPNMVSVWSIPLTLVGVEKIFNFFNRFFFWKKIPKICKFVVNLYQN